MPKTIFNSTEKSNFILNLTEEKFSKIAVGGILSACFMTSLFTMIPEIANNSGLYSMCSVGLAISGVFCMIITLIAFIRKFVGGKKSNIIAVSAFGFMLIWGIVSSIFSYDLNIALYGYPARGEGLFAIVFYFSFFVTGMSVKTKKALEFLIYGVCGTGLLNALWGLVQVFTGKLGHYKFVRIDVQANASSGLSQSPIFLAMLLTVSVTVSLVSLVLSDGKNNKNKYKNIFLIICSCVCSFCAMFTYSLVGICGMALSVLVCLFTALAVKKPKKLLSLLSCVVPAVCAVVIVNAGLIGEIDSYRLYDGGIMLWADGYYRANANGQTEAKSIDLNDTADVYSKLNSKALNIARQSPLTGTGPDQLVFPQLYTSGDFEDGYTPQDVSEIVVRNKNTFDKVYNDYIYTCSTRGVPSLIALLIILISVISACVKNIRSGNSSEKIVLSIASAVSIVILFISVSNITFSPVFWCISGAVLSQQKN